MVLTSEQAVDETHVCYSSTVNLHVEITFVVVVSQKTTKNTKNVESERKLVCELMRMSGGRFEFINFNCLDHSCHTLT